MQTRIRRDVSILRLIDDNKIDMSISLLLNFPKIRSMTQDVNVVRDAIKYVLSTDSSCNYEIDESETRIKKRIL